MRVLQFTILLLVALGLAGCSTNSATPKTYKAPTAKKLADYQKTMSLVASGIKHDSKYNKIELDTPQKKAWFKQLTYQLWDRQISNKEFMAMGLAKYPTHKYEFDFVIRGFAKY